ncbi:MAG TPA: hypothetical protein VJU58_13750 [Microbacterium sp.]|nr:hypothetical protein [Microbacterium sp.]
MFPEIGDVITEGMGRYRVIEHADGPRYRVRSLASGITLCIDWNDSGYRDPRNAWRLA